MEDLMIESLGVEEIESNSESSLQDSLAFNKSKLQEDEEKKIKYDALDLDWGVVFTFFKKPKTIKNEIKNTNVDTNDNDSRNEIENENINNKQSINTLEIMKAKTKSKAGRKPATPSRSVKGKTTTARCSTSGSKLATKKVKASTKSKAGSYLASKC